MAQLRGCLTRLLRLPRHCGYVRGSSSVQICTLGLNDGSCLDRFAPLYLTQNPVPCRYYCVKVSTAEETETISQDRKVESESSISVRDARNIALNSLLQNMPMSELLKQLKILLQKNRIRSMYLKKEREEICEAYFQRLAELVLENPDLKEERTKQLLEDPSFKVFSQFFEDSRFIAVPLIITALSSMLQIFSEDVPIIKNLETVFLAKMNSGNVMLVSLQKMADLHENHQETGLRKLIYQSAVKRIEEFSESQTRSRATKILVWPDVMMEDGNSPALQELQGQALMNADKLGLGDVNRVLSLLASKKIRNKPLIDVLVHRLKTSELHFTVKGLKSLLFACCELSVNDQGLMKELLKNLLHILPSITNLDDKKYLYPILISCSRLRWKNEDVIRTLVNEILVLLSLGSLELNKLTSVILSLGQLNWAESDLIIDAVLETKNTLQEDPLQWLNIVWSLVVLKKGLGDIVPGVLADGFCHEVQELISDKPEYIKTSVHTKLLNIAGCSTLELNSEVKPTNYDAWMEDYKKSHQNHSSFLHKTVGAALQSLQPVSVTSNKIVDYGYILDYEFQMSGKDGTGGDKDKVYSFGVKLLDYKDMLRTPDIPEPDGRNALCIRHLEKMGYNLIIVPYYEWNEQAGAELKQKYLREKIEAAQIEAHINAVIDSTVQTEQIRDSQAAHTTHVGGSEAAHTSESQDSQASDSKTSRTKGTNMKSGSKFDVPDF